ncbi:MAG TPA: hypothetical protein VD884_13335 [Ohtaekwangia sp.]|nr:hypothetical protein [Ohtaekwangia sp.]
MRQITATYHFSENYRTRNFSQAEATVILDIDYNTKSFSIKPYTSCDASFKFIQTSHQWEMWKAILKAIDRAIDFANQEVGNTPKHADGAAINAGFAKL